MELKNYAGLSVEGEISTRIISSSFARNEKVKNPAESSDTK